MVSLVLLGQPCPRGPSPPPSRPPGLQGPRPHPTQLPQKPCPSPGGRPARNAQGRLCLCREAQLLGSRGG